MYILCTLHTRSKISGTPYIQCALRTKTTVNPVRTPSGEGSGYDGNGDGDEAHDGELKLQFLVVVVAVAVMVL